MGKQHFSGTHLIGDLFPICDRWRHIAEGRKSNHKNDSGGFTVGGMSWGFFKGLSLKDGDLDGDGDVDRDDLSKITLEKEEQLFRDYFWEPYLCDRMNFIPAICLFDSVINHRPRVAVKLFQSSIDTNADGFVGNNTVDAANSISNPEQFLADHLSRRRSLYRSIVNSNSSQRVFLDGWLNRMDKLEAFIFIVERGETKQEFIDYWKDRPLQDLEWLIFKIVKKLKQDRQQ
tara:strand:- start:505 stop:1197 length:693 start_codon:yes stop_codon:yes gene_type:complete